MTREEDIVRSTVAALASTVTEVRPLRLTKPGDPDAKGEVTGGAPDGPVSNGIRPGGLLPPVTPLRLDGASRPRLGRRWRTWGAPVAAGVLVIALAITLIVIKQASNGGRVTPVGPAHSASPAHSGSPAISATPPRSGPVPRYFVELIPEGPGAPPRQGLLVGDTVTGQTIGTVKPPAGAAFMSVSAAADDRTFAILVKPANAGSTWAGLWYLLRLAPGTSSPTRLTRIPIKQLPDVSATALSSSGRELAIGQSHDQRGTPSVSVYSVTSGRLLHSWSTRGTAPFRIEGFGRASIGGLAAQSSALTWVQNDQAIMFVTTTTGSIEAGAVRRLDLATGGSDIVKDSQVIWSAPRGSCQVGAASLSANGSSVTCMTTAINTVGKVVKWTMQWLSYPLAPSAAPTVRYRVSVPAPPSEGLNVNTLWVSASGDAMLVEWSLRGSTGIMVTQRFGSVSHGIFTPLKVPPGGGDYIVTTSPLFAW